MFRILSDRYVLLKKVSQPISSDPYEIVRDFEDFIYNENIKDVENAGFEEGLL